MALDGAFLGAEPPESHPGKQSYNFPGPMTLSDRNF
jgi:hypothetical protein